MTRGEEHTCGFCGQSTGYFSTVNGGIVDSLRKIAWAIEEKGINVINIKKEMVDQGKLSVTAYHNVSHMTRLGLVAKIEKEPGNYCLTRRALDFLDGGFIPRYVRVEKKTKDHASRKIESSDNFCVIGEFLANKDWAGIGFEIHEGRVINKPTVKSAQESLI